MEHSEYTSAAPAEASKTSYVSVMLKALASASVFGFLGGWLGAWLGERGNDTHRQMAKPIMQWGMAGFSAILAAYSSLKASERSEQEKHDARVTGSGPVVSVALKEAPLLQTKEAEHQGKISAEHRDISRG